MMKCQHMSMQIFENDEGGSSMQYRVNPRTGEKMSVLGFGCMRLPKTVTAIDYRKSEQLILRAIEAGVNYFDTAWLYPGSEAILGEFLQKNNARGQILLATKLPIANCKTRNDFDRYFSEQLVRLKTDYIDLYLLHNINSFRQWEELRALGIEDWIQAQKSAGTIRQIGYSFHGAGGEFLKIIDSYDWDFCQIQYNYSDENYQAGVTGLRRAAEKNMPVIIMEPLLGGKLATGLPKQAEKVFRTFSPNRSPASWGLRWLLDQPEVTVILSGMNREEQLEDNLNTAAEVQPGMITPEEREVYRQVIEIFRRSFKVPCTGCGYCQPCPHGINIPGCFAAYNTSYSMGWMTGMFQYVTSTGANRAAGQTASCCVGCGVCEKHCPQNISIRESLKQVRRRMEPFYFDFVMKTMRNKTK